MNAGIRDTDQKRLYRWRFVEMEEGRIPNFQGGTKESYSGINLMLMLILNVTKKL
jgi:hypothetical protein